MAVRIETVLQAVRDICPPHYALDGDATGLQVGRSDREVERVLCTLDLSLEVAREAVERGAGLILSHHAVIFRPLRQLRTDTFKGRILSTLIKGDVAVYVPHTALDVAEKGMNDHLAAAVGLAETRFLEETGREEAVLLVVSGGDPTVLEAAYAAGALRGEQRGERLELVVPERAARAVGRLLEERCGAAPRSWRLRSDALPRGIGRVGRLPQPEPVLALAARLKQRLGAPGVRVVAADPAAQVYKVAVLGGDGRRFLKAAIRSGADALVTGDIDHHTALEARARGIALIDPGHWASERQVMDILVTGLRERLAGESLEIVASDVDTQPFLFV